MIIKQKQEDGTEIDVEVFSNEELDAKLSEKEKEFEAKITEKDNSLQTLAKEKAELESKIGGVKEDHPNFKILKEALSKKDEDIKSLRDEVENDKKQRVQESFDAKIKIASKGNADLEKKIKLNLSSTVAGMPESTEQERDAKLNAALKMSIDITEPSIFDTVHTNNSIGNFNPQDTISGVEFSSREKALGAKLGISAEDYKKYGPRLNKK